MEPLKLKYVPNSKKKAPQTKNQELADQIHTYFNKRLSFAQIMGMIKQKGYQGVYEAWNETVQSEAKDTLALFIYKVGQQKIIWLHGKNSSGHSHDSK